VPVAIAMAACLYFGIRVAQPRLAPPKPDIFGLTAFGVGLALIYAALDQGNRLDWPELGAGAGPALGGAPCC